MWDGEDTFRIRHLSAGAPYSTTTPALPFTRYYVRTSASGRLTTVQVLTTLHCVHIQYTTGAYSTPARVGRPAR